MPSVICMQCNVGRILDIQDLVPRLTHVLTEPLGAVRSPEPKPGFRRG